MRYMPVLFMACVALATSHGAIAQEASPSSGKIVVSASNHFAIDLYGRLDKEQPGKNLFFSPISISLALTMTAAGARGQTEAEMAKVLHLGDSLSQSHSYYHKLLEQWNAVDEKRPYQLRLANRLWGQRGFPVRREFLDLTRQQYDAEMTLVDFAQPEAARREINLWVERQTNDKIKDLIPRNAIDPLTRLVLTNAIYFKGGWLSPFDKRSTTDQDFTVSAKRKTKARLMCQTAHFGYAEEESLQALEMPYQGRDLSMVVLLPKELNGLPDLEKSLSAEWLDKLLSRLHSREVITFIPRFKEEAGFKLNKTLIALGMKLAFGLGGADFSGISTAGDLCITAVIHKAFVDVNETGTEAAAATAVIVTGASPFQPPTPIFRADHPFLFLIRDNRSGAILFIGRLIEPVP